MAVDDNRLFDENLLFSNFVSEDHDEESIVTNQKKARKRKYSGEENDYNGEELEIQKDRYIQELEEQNTRLKAIIKRLCGPHELVSNETDDKNGINQDISPLAVVLYLSNRLCQARKSEIDHFFKDLAAKDATEELSVTQELRHQPSAVPLRPFSSDSQGKRFHKSKKVKGKQDPYIVTSVQYFKGFCFDRLGEPLHDHNASITQNWDVPSYKQSFMKALPINDDGGKIGVPKIRTLSCFNCEGNHNLCDCKEPRDFAKISANRKAFQEKFGSPATPESRYHASQEDDERFQCFKPGTISETLRKALGMQDCDLPPYIYRMRILGYPPGYLKPIDQELVIYNAEGFVEASDFNEDGEIIQAKEPPKILYPGFNCRMPQGVIDRGHQYRVPLYQPEIYEEEYDMESNTVDTAHLDRIMDPNTGMDMETEEYVIIDSYEKPPVPSIDLGEEKPPLPLEDEPKVISSSDIQKKVESLLTIAKKEAEQVVVLDNFLKGVQSNDQEDGLTNSNTCRQWWLEQPLTSTGAVYCTYTPPPSLKQEVCLQDIPSKPVTDLDREPWKTASMSWYDPLYGDLAERTGMYESIREILKNRKKKKRKKIK